MHAIRDWLSSWAETLRIMIFNRELYRQLREPFEEGDFDEVQRPGGEDD